MPSSQPTLLCTVRDCRLPLAREIRRLVCGHGHSFDIARSGYSNLLQPQDRRSKHPGDTPAAVAARRALHDLGVTQPLLAAISQSLSATPQDTVLDIGAGDGFYLGRLAAQIGFEAHGIDISIPAVDLAARRYPDCHWIVANADRFIPYGDSSFSYVLSITARHNSAEFHRVLKPGGKLLLALPAPDDLIELRGIGRDRVSRILPSFTSHFNLIHQQRATTSATLDASTIEKILLLIYRPLQAKPTQVTTQVTFSLDLLLLTPIGETTPRILGDSLS